MIILNLPKNLNKAIWLEYPFKYVGESLESNLTIGLSFQEWQYLENYKDWSNIPELLFSNTGRVGFYWNVISVGFNPVLGDWDRYGKEVGPLFGGVYYMSASKTR